MGLLGLGLYRGLQRASERFLKIYLLLLGMVQYILLQIQ